MTSDYLKQMLAVAGLIPADTKLSRNAQRYLDLEIRAGRVLIGYVNGAHVYVTKQCNKLRPEKS